MNNYLNHESEVEQYENCEDNCDQLDLEYIAPTSIFDSNGDGVETVEELTTQLQEMGFTAEQIAEILAEADPDGDGIVEDLDQLEEIVIFERYDGNDDGVITTEEVEEYLLE